MSSNEHHNQHNSGDGESFTLPPGPQSGSPGNAEIIEAIRLLQIGTPPINSIEFAETTSILANLQPLTPFAGNEDSHRVAMGATTRCPATDG